MNDDTLTIRTGTHVYHPATHQHGYIVEISEAPSTVHVLGMGGLAPGGAELTIVWVDGDEVGERVETYPEALAATWIAAGERMNYAPISDERCAELSIEARKAFAARAAAQDAARESEAAAYQAFRAEAEKRMPAWAKAVIVAERQEDESDSMTDYFHVSTKETVILAWSRSTRNNFAEMRKVAAALPETQHLAIPAEGDEHRENYRGGRGYYLKRGGSYSNGWAIKKWTLYRGADSVPMGRWAIPEAAAETVSAGDLDASIEEHVHTKRGITMHLVVLGDRVERDVFEALRDRAKQMGGWYSRKWGRTPAGFAFEARSDAGAFVAAISEKEAV